MIHETAPAADLAGCIEVWWWIDGPPARPIRVLPDGCTDVVFGPDGAFVVGTMTRSLLVESTSGTFGVRFRPGRAAALLRTPLALLTDARVPLSNVAPRIRFAGEDIGQIEAELRPFLMDAHYDPRVTAAVDALVETGGRIPVESVASMVGMSRQHLARSFAVHVGISPKAFARVMRFRRAVALGRAGGRSWADLAAESGYFDQSHLIADFRELGGDTPVPFFQSPGA
ncbi:MAG TPA: helix-turn-helix transcriptional regulator [Thermoanaerobaculia bacterium]|nr:helix-turn-helix transcriptional regulator [Thermoanaerobaculia bacterium]